MTAALPWHIHAIGQIYSPHVRNRMPDGTIPLAVAEPYPATALERMRAGWAVMTGKAVAFAWPQPGDLERATGERIPRSNGPGCSTDQARNVGMIAGARPPTSAEALAAKQECIDYWGNRASRAETEAARLRTELDSFLAIQRRG
jgi:hypothetical protein